LPDPATYHLCDGIVLARRRGGNVVVDLQGGREVKVEGESWPVLESLAGSGSIAEGGLCDRLCADGITALGAATVDGVLLARLAHLDKLFLGTYEAHLSARVRAAYDKTLRAHARRKRICDHVGECPALPETCLRRALTIGDAERVGAQRIVCLGDDDFVAVALAALGHRVTVLDQDPLVLHQIARINEEFSLFIDARECDWRDPLDPELCGAFDVFVTDPMANAASFELVLSRGAALVRPGGTGYVAVAQASGQLFWRITGEMSFAPGVEHARFNRYYNSRLLLHQHESDWLEVKTDSTTHPKCPADASFFSADLYAEEFAALPAKLLALVDDIDTVERAMPLYLSWLLEHVDRRSGLGLSDQGSHAADNWTALWGTTTSGYLTLHADRECRQIMAELFPFEAKVDQLLLASILAAHKSQGDTRPEPQINASEEVFDLRYGTP